MEYTYERAMTENGYDINNPLRVDENGDQIYLAKEIEAALPGKMFVLRCNDVVANIIFEEELTASEKATLDAVVADHRANT